MEKNVGIDFGTTNTVIYSRDARGTLKKIGGESIRSAVYFLTRDDYIIGDDAIKQAAFGQRCQALVTDFKPKIKERIEIVAENGKTFSIKGEAVARLFLTKVFTDYVQPRFKKMFGTVEMTDADKTVITVPAKFDAEKKARIKNAAKIAYFKNVGIAFEPTAAAVAASDSDVDDDIIAVYDFGGGTFDVSVIEKNSSDHYVSLDEDGDPELGGNLITDTIAEKIFIPLLAEQGIEMSMDIEEMEFDEENSMSEEEYLQNIWDVKDYIEGLKEHFSEDDDTYSGQINILQNGEKNTVDVELTKEDFEEAIRDQVQKTVNITRRVINRVKEKDKDVRKIIMAGGSSQLSLAERLLKKEFEDKGIRILLSDSAFNLIAKGALLMSEQQRLIRVEEKTATQFGVGIRTGIGRNKFDMLIDVDQQLPVSSRKHFSIDSNILSAGEVAIPCYERDVKNYPGAVFEGDAGIAHINTYRIAFDRSLQPSGIEVAFDIARDGTLKLSTSLYDRNGNRIKNFNAEIMSDNELE